MMVRIIRSHATQAGAEWRFQASVQGWVMTDRKVEPRIIIHRDHRRTAGIEAGSCGGCDSGTDIPELTNDKQNVVNGDNAITVEITGARCRTVAANTM